MNNRYLKRPDVNIIADFSAFCSFDKQSTCKSRMDKIAQQQILQGIFILISISMISPFLRLPPTPLVFSNNFHFSNGVIAFSDGQSDSSSLLYTLNACLFSSFCKENVGETEALNLFVKFRLVRGLPRLWAKQHFFSCVK